MSTTNIAHNGHAQGEQAGFCNLPLENTGDCPLSCSSTYKQMKTMQSTSIFFRQKGINDLRLSHFRLLVPLRFSLLG
jgi:hypothetical protein